MYVAVKGGEQAIANAHALLAKRGRGDHEDPEIAPTQVRDQLGVLVSRVMTEGSLYDPELASRAIVQSQGDALEAVTLMRTYRTTLPRFGTSVAIDTAGLPSERRVSATFKDLPGGQQLGATFDYTHRLLSETTELPDIEGEAKPAEAMPRVTDLLGANALIEPVTNHPDEDPEPADLTREPTVFPMSRAERMQALARGDEGFLLGIGYSTLRGYGGNHPFVGEVRVGEVEVEFVPPEFGFPVFVGRIEVTECQMVAQFVGSSEVPPMFTRGYGLAFGRSERKAMSMSLVDRAMRWKELGERNVAPANDEEFVIEHADAVQATGFVEHLKLPHYVDFQAELGLIRGMHEEIRTRSTVGANGVESLADELEVSE
jgi:alpha-D-ribose 1-methylphosphonate 5-triphosphate synthase subunit PhnI